MSAQPLPAHHAHLDDADVRAIVRLLGEVAGMHGSIQTKKRRVMEGLSELIRADMWACAIGTINNPQGAPTLLSFQYDHISVDERAAMTTYGQDAERPAPENVASAQLIAQAFHWTRRRDQLVSDAEWYGDPVNLQRHREMGYEDFLYSSYPLSEPGTYSIFGFYRRFGRAGFTDRDCRLIHIVTAEVDWLHEEREPVRNAQQMGTLPPRLRTVFILMLDGWDRQAIARQMHLSPHTVSDYMKQIYHHFGVDGHVALLRRFMAGERTGYDDPLEDAGPDALAPDT